MKNRTVGSHNMNDCSSRSHTMLTVYITSEQQVSIICIIHTYLIQHNYMYYIIFINIHKNNNIVIH